MDSQSVNELVGQCVNQGDRQAARRLECIEVMEKKKKWERNGNNVIRYLPLIKSNDICPKSKK
jgi:hypothetical protein